jgi:hypothetical protein
VSQLVVNDQTGIGGLTGEGNTPLIFGRQAFLDGMAEILDTATEWLVPTGRRTRSPRAQ